MQRCLPKNGKKKNPSDGLEFKFDYTRSGYLIVVPGRVLAHNPVRVQIDAGPSLTGLQRLANPSSVTTKHIRQHRLAPGPDRTLFHGALALQPFLVERDLEGPVRSVVVDLLRGLTNDRN